MGSRRETRCRIIRYPDTGESGEAYEVEMTRPGNGPYVTAAYIDGKIHANITIPVPIHEKILGQLQSANQNRNAWIVQAIEERLARDSRGGDRIEKQVLV